MSEIQATGALSAWQVMNCQSFKILNILFRSQFQLSFSSPSGEESCMTSRFIDTLWVITQGLHDMLKKQLSRKLEDYKDGLGFT